MGKRIVQQRRGRGTMRYKSPIHKFKYFFRFPQKQENPVLGTIIDLKKDPSKTAPLAIVKYEDNTQAVIPAPLGIRIGSKVTFGTDSPNPGNIMELSQIPEGTEIYAIEKIPGSGPSFCRTAGSFARVITKIKGNVTIQFSSKKQKKFN